MPTLVVVVPELVAPDESSSVLLGSHPILTRFAENGEVLALRALGNLETPEACYLGLKPDEAQMRPGPLMVSALGADPPTRSTHFLVSVMGLRGEGLAFPVALPDAAESQQLTDVFRFLNTKALTLLQGEELEHGLVWEGIGDVMTVPPSDAVGKPLAEVLPQGDLEKSLRRFNDDSINILMETEFNRIRLEEGRMPLVVLWPWGQGIRYPTPNLALKRGGPARVQSESYRMLGLTRLVGYRHGDRKQFQSGLNLDLPGLVKELPDSMPLLLVASGVGQMRANGQMEELEWFLNRIETEYLSPVWDWAKSVEEKGESVSFALVAPSVGCEGLALRYESGVAGGRPLPFDERSLEERTIRRTNTHEVIDRVLSARS